ncbi:monooxygenase [Georgenia yuyongxinii]|uniref:Monooxygenase n=1 Tax=Georgenia yuyongxinii TaxID=2589797 RepID=A0A552WSX6_9MICO|nr:monooxygenase [Georgenia yuyongxinii]
MLVVGAGPTGLALAAQLARFGTTVRIVDRSRDRSHESRALAIQPRTLEVLDPLGVSEDLVARGRPGVDVRVHAGGAVVPLRLLARGLEDTAFPFLLFLSQAETERVLVEHLADGGLVVERGVELVALSQGTGRLCCRLRHADGGAEEVRARYVVGCDGAHSTVRHLAGITFRGGAYPQTFVLADLETDALTPGAAHVFVADQGLLFFFPLGVPSTWRLLAMRPRSDTTPPERAVTLEEVQALTDAYTSGVRLRDPAWMTNFRLHHRVAARYQAGRVFLAGDAAHIHSPAGAQGMNTGIQDAVNLGWKLALVCGGTGAPALLDTYGSEREPIGRAVLRMSNRAFTVATSMSLPARIARRRLAPLLAPVVARLLPGRPTISRALAELNLRYPRSLLSGHGRDDRRPRPGDRVPDCPVTDTKGRPTTLHRLLRAPAFHLLLVGPPDDWRDAVVPSGVVAHHLGPTGSRDANNRLVQARLGLKDRSGHVLVRPDGHVAVRDGTDLRTVDAYLRHWLPGSRSESPTPLGDSAA